MPGAGDRSSRGGRLAVYLAGAVAEGHHTGTDVLTILNEGARFEGSDLNRARREAQRLVRLGHYRTPDGALLAAEQLARELLTAHWHFVLQTAHKLVVQGRIE